MAKFKVYDPDGRRYVVEGPDDATPEELQQRLSYYLDHEKPGVIGSALRGFERGALPAVAGMFGAGVGSVAGPVGAVGGGLGAAYAAQAAQEKFLESNPGFAKAVGLDPETQQRDQSEHPWASGIGSIAPNLAPGVGVMRTGLGFLKGASRDLAPFAKSAVGKTAEELTAKEKEATDEISAIRELRKRTAKTSLTGAGIMTGINLAQQTLSDQPFDYRDLILSAGAGALGTEETKLGTRVRTAGENLVNRVRGRPLTEIVPPAAESATPSSPDTPDEMGESAPAAGVMTKEEKQQAKKEAKAKAKAEKESAAAAAGTVPLTDILGADASAYPKGAAPAPAPEPAKVATVDKPVETPPSEAANGQPPSTVLPDAVSGAPADSAGVPVQPDPAAGAGTAQPVRARLVNPDGSLSLTNGGEEAPPTPLVPQIGPSAKLPEITPLGPERVHELHEPVPPPPPNAVPPSDDLLDRIGQLKMILPDSYESRLAWLQKRVLDVIKNKGDTSQLTGVQREVDKLYEVGRLHAGREPIVKAPVVPTIPGKSTEALKSLLREGNLGKVIQHLSGNDPESEFFKTRKALMSARNKMEPTDPRLAELEQAYNDALHADAQSAKPVDSEVSRPINRELAARLQELKLDLSGIKINAEGAKGYDKEAIDKLHKGNHAGAYDPLTNTIHLTEQGMNDRDVLHEAVHAATVRVLHDFAKDPNRVTDPEQRYAAEHINKIYKLADGAMGREARAKFNHAFSNVYEFVAHAMTHPEFQAELAKLRSRELTQYSHHGKMNLTESSIKAGRKKVSLWSQFVKAISRMLNMPTRMKQGNLLLESTAAIDNILSKPTVVKGFSRKTALYAKKAAPPVDRGMAELRKGQAEQIEKLIPNKSPKAVSKNIFKKIVNADYEKFVTNFENERRIFKHLERNLGPLLRIKGLKQDYNDIHSRIAAAGALGQDAIINQMNPHLKAMHEAIHSYANERKISIKEALADLNLYRTALHEPERRATLFAMESPLSLTKKYTLPSGAQVVAADLRKAIELHLHQNVQYQGMHLKQMRQIIDDLTNPKNGYLDATGYSKSGKTSIDPNDMNAYRVAGTYSEKELEMLRNMHGAEMKDPKLQPKLQRVWDTLKDVQDKTKELNRKAKYWSTPVDNLVGFYGYEHYVPFKGEPNSNGDRYDHGSLRLGGSYSEYERKAEGRHSDSENTMVQSMADAARSAARLGRSDVGTAFQNLIKMGQIKTKGEVMHVPFSDRYNDVEITKDIQKQNRFIKYNDDGSFDVYKIDKKSMPMLEALKGEIQDREGFLRKAADVIRPFTSTMGRMHTLLNVSFAPYNYARHLITNSLAISSEHGLGKLAQIFTKAATNTVSGKMLSAMRHYHNYLKGDDAALRAAKPGSFAANLYEYLKNGGDTTMMDALSPKAIAQQLQEGAVRVNGNLVHKTTDKIGHLLQMWAHGFELTNRATMYGVLKQQALKDLAAKGIVGDELEAQARSYAANYAKDLLNFQNVGRFGRDLSSVFMFYRAATTGAVRALDALRPAFISLDSHLKSIPENLKLTPEMIAAHTARYKKLQYNARATAAFMFGTGFAVHQIARMMAGDDEQGRNIVSTDNMDQWQRNMRFPAAFLGGSNNNNFIQFPWGYGIGSIGAAGAQLSGYLEGHTPLKDLMWNVLNPLRESFFPIPTANFNPLEDPSTGLKFVVDSIMPSMFRPLVEGAMNIDTFGREVTSTHTSKYGDIYSAGESIPDIYKTVSASIMDHTGLDINPSTVQFIMNNYVDGAARVVQNFHADVQAGEGVGNWDPKRSLATMAVTDFIGKKTSLDAKEFNDVEKDVLRMRSVVNMYMSTGRMDQLQSYLDSHKNALALITLYDAQVNSSIKVFRQLITQIESSQLTPKSKHDLLKDLKFGRDIAMSGFVTAYKDITH